MLQSILNANNIITKEEQRTIQGGIDTELVFCIRECRDANPDREQFGICVQECFR